MDVGTATLAVGLGAPTITALLGYLGISHQTRTNHRQNTILLGQAINGLHSLATEYDDHLREYHGTPRGPRMPIQVQAAGTGG